MAIHHHPPPPSHQPPPGEQHHPQNQQPADSQSESELRLSSQIEDEHRLGPSNWLPLILILLPNLASVLFDGDPQSWRDSLVFLLISFFFYKLSIAPWQLYASARTHRIILQSRPLHPSSRPSTSPEHPSSTRLIYPDRSNQFLTELKSYETGFLLLAILSPALGLALLNLLQSKLDLGFDYLNSNSSILFLLSSSIKPLGHLYHRLLNRSRYLQSQLNFPTQLVDQFNESLDELSHRLAQLESVSLTKSELKSFQRNRIDRPIIKLSNRLSNFESNDEAFQLASVSRLSNLETCLDQLNLKLDRAQRSLETLILPQPPHLNPPNPTESISDAIFQLFDQSHPPPPHHHHHNLSKSSPELISLVQDIRASDPQSDHDPIRNEAGTQPRNRTSWIKDSRNLTHQLYHISFVILLISLTWPIKSISYLYSTGLRLMTIIIIRPIIQIYRSIMTIKPTKALMIDRKSQIASHSRRRSPDQIDHPPHRLRFRSIKSTPKQHHPSLVPIKPEERHDHHDHHHEQEKDRSEDEDDGGLTSNSSNNPSPASINSSLILDHPSHDPIVISQTSHKSNSQEQDLMCCWSQDHHPRILIDHPTHPHHRVGFHQGLHTTSPHPTAL